MQTHSAKILTHIFFYQAVSCEPERFRLFIGTYLYSIYLCQTNHPCTREYHIRRAHARTIKFTEFSRSITISLFIYTIFLFSFFCSSAFSGRGRNFRARARRLFVAVGAVGAASVLFRFSSRAFIRPNQMVS